MDNKKKSASPERATTGSKSGKSKKARAKEEEERRLEEEARQKAEQEAIALKQQAILLAAEQKSRENKINELKKRELVVFQDLVNELKAKAKSFHHEKREKYKWERYIKCDGSPDPTISGEIYTFLTLWREDLDDKDFVSCLKNISLAIKLIDELNTLISDLEKNQLSQDLVVKYKQTVRDLQEVALLKIDQTSQTLMLDASDQTDPETLNFSFADGTTAELFMCLWANLSHNPRIKEFTFAEKAFTFTLPRPLTLAHVAVRVVFQNNDVYSPQSRTHSCRVKKVDYEFDAIVEDEEESKEEEKIEEDEDSMGLLSSEPTDLDQKVENEDGQNENAEESEAAAAEKREKNDDANDENGDANGEPKEPELNEEEKLEKLKKEEQLASELAVLQELSDTFVVDLRNFLPIGPIFNFGLFNIPPQPKKIKQWTIIQKDENNVLSKFAYPVAEPNLAGLSWSEYWSKKQESEGNLTQQKISENDALETTQNNKKSIDPNVTQKSNDILESTIGADDTIASDANKQFLKGMLNKSNENLVKQMKNEGPLHINFKTPTNVYYGEAPSVARWDAERKQWRTDEILDFKYNDESREIHFKTYHFSPFCLLQDRHVHMPFQLWRMAPRAQPNNCMFTVEASSFEINIEILNDQLRVFVPVKPKQTEETLTSASKSKFSNSKVAPKKVEHVSRLDYEALSPNAPLAKVLESVANKWFNLRDFSIALKSIGLNIFPEEDSDKFVNITNKNKRLEWLCYQNMALCSSVASFAYSKWNSETNDENKMVCLVQSHLADKEPNADLYKCLVGTSDIFNLTESNEVSDDFSFNTLKGTNEHADLYHLCLEDLTDSESCKAEMDARIKQIDPIYFETCLSFLESIKLLTFS